jgi:hypothetical protein
MQRQHDNTCGTIILTVILIALAPFILQVIGFILFMLFISIASALGG